MSRRSPLAPFLLLLSLVSASSLVVRADDVDPSYPNADAARAELDRRGIAYDVVSMCDAAREGDLEVVRLFLDAGPNVDLRDYGYTTALYNAAMGSQPDAVRLLLERGADPNLAAGDGMTPLHAALESGWNRISDGPVEGQPDVVRALVESPRTNVDARDVEGRTPLLYAAKTGDRGAFDLLLDRGADPDAADAAGNTALSISQEFSRNAFVLALVERGAKGSRWIRAQYFFYRFARVQAWVMPFFIVFITVMVFALDSRRPELPKKEDVAAPDGLARLAPLSCANCAATVPLGAPDRRCASCGREFPIPADYAATLDLRARATRDIGRAIRMWRRARIFNSPIVSLFLLALGPVWLVGSYIGAGAGSVGELPGLMIASTIAAGWTFGFGLMGYAIYLMSERRAVPPMPRVTEGLGSDEAVHCTQCGGDVVVPRKRFGVACDYCGSELFRPAFARAARGVAADEQHAAASAFVGALTQLYDMRDTLVSGMFLATFLVVGTGLFIVAVALWEYAKSLVGL